MERGRQAPNVNRFQLNPSSPVKVLTKVCARTHLFPHSAINGSCSISPYSILPIRNLNKIRGRTQAQNELEQGVLCSVWSEPVGRHYILPRCTEILPPKRSFRKQHKRQHSTEGSSVHPLVYTKRRSHQTTDGLEVDRTTQVNRIQQEPYTTCQGD